MGTHAYIAPSLFKTCPLLTDQLDEIHKRSCIRLALMHNPCPWMYRQQRIAFWHIQAHKYIWLYRQEIIALCRIHVLHHLSFKRNSLHNIYSCLKHIRGLNIGLWLSIYYYIRTFLPFANCILLTTGIYKLQTTAFSHAYITNLQVHIFHNLDFPNRSKNTAYSCRKIQQVQAKACGCIHMH